MPGGMESLRGFSRLCVLQGGLPGDPMTSPLAPTMQPGSSSGAGESAPAAATAHAQGPVNVPAHSSEQQVQDLPIFNQDPNAASASMAAGAPGMPLAGIHVSSSIVTGGLPFGNMGAAQGGVAGAALGTDGAATEARRMEGMPNPDGSTDVGGMIIQLELPQDGGSVTSIQTTGIGQLGSVLQNMMQEQLAFARERIRDQSGGVGTGGAGGTGAGGAVATGTSGGDAASGAPVGGTPSTLPANPTGSPTRIAGGSERGSGAGAGSTTAALSLPTQVLRLTQQLVSDVRRQQALPEEERDAEASRLARVYLQQVPDMLRSALPQVAAGVNDFMQRGQGPDSTSSDRAAPADVTAPSSAAAAAPAAPSTVAAADPLPTVSVADAGPAPSAQPAAAAAPVSTAEDAAPNQGKFEEEKDVDTGLDAEARFRAAIKQAAEGASTSSAALGGGSSSAGPSRAGPSLPKRPGPKGLAGGLKPRKARSAAPTPPASGTASGGTPAPASAVTVSGPATGLPTGGAAATGGSGGGPLDMLMPLMQSPQMQQMLNSPQVQGMAEQMSSGNADLGSLMQSMMPMVSSMLGGSPATAGEANPSAPSGQGARSAGAGTSRTNSMPPAASAEMKAMLVQELGPEEAARWQKVIKQDKGALQRASKFAGQRSSAYAAGSTRDAEGDKGFMF